MDEVEIVGIQSVNFTDDAGVQVTGLSLYYTQIRERVEGVATGKFFLSAKRIEGLAYVPKLHDLVRVFYNQFGRPMSFELVSAQK